jgi:hypothetical protein
VIARIFVREPLPPELVSAVVITSDIVLLLTVLWAIRQRGRGR